MSRHFSWIWKSRLRLDGNKSQGPSKQQPYVYPPLQASLEVARLDGRKPQGASKEQLYVYSPLQASSEEIRLLTLLPGPFGTTIQCELHTTKLDKDSPPRYEALSYAWGSKEDLVTIYIGKGALPVTQNLASALQHLRYPSRSRTLWIDAICVNQLDLNERAQQVARMANIYTLANFVVVWLGLKADDSSRILRIFNTIGSMIDTDMLDGPMKPSGAALSTGELHWADRNAEMPFKERELEKAHPLLSRAWFERLWVRQEISLATKAVLICGFETLPWFRFRTAIIYLHAKISNNRHIVDDFPRFWDRLKLIFALCSQNQGLSLRQQIRRTQHCKCMDPRDRIYALLAISKLPESVHIAVDYRKTEDQLFQDVVLQHYKQRLNPLADCEMQNFQSERPSWVPNWTVPRLAEAISPFQAGGNSDSDAKHIAGNILRVIGMRVTKVRISEYMAFPYKLGGEYITAIRKHAPSGLILDSTQVLDVYCRTLLFNNFSDTFEPPLDNCLNFEESREVLRSIMDGYQPLLPNAHIRQFVSRAAATMQNRSFFWTEDGRMGLGPGLAKTADEIIIFPGCPSPMILRPSHNRNGQYRVVGECFIHGLMNGEALFGPLPEGYEQVGNLNYTAGAYCDAFRDIGSGNIQDEDPRFGLLFSERREDGVRRVYPTGPPNIQHKEYIGTRAWTSSRKGGGEMIEIMRNDLEPFFLE